MSDDQRKKQDRTIHPKEPIPAIEGVEEISETELDQVAGGLACETVTGCPFTMT